MNDQQRRRYIRGIIQSLVILGGLVVVTFMFQRVPAISVVSIQTATELDSLYQPVQITDVYRPDDEFYASVEVRGYKPSMEVMAEWQYEGQTIAETPLETQGSGDGFAGFTLRSNDPWPVGGYTVIVLLDDQELASHKFEVAAE